MKLIITGKNFSVSEQLNNTIESKFGRLEKYFSGEIEVYVTLEVEKSRHSIEVTIPVRGTILRAEETTNDMYSSIDNVIDKLSMQIAKYKTKLQKKYKEHSEFRFDQISDEYSEDNEKKVVKSKKFDIKPMNIEEAIMQMELLGHNFFVYINAETDSVNVLYKRNDNQYGLLEPNY